MTFHSLGSASSGNLYMLESDKDILVLEAGLPLLQVKKALDFDLSKVRGTLISHRHRDHAGHIKEFMQAGIPVYSSDDVFGSQDLSSLRPWQRVIEPEKTYKIGEFRVMPFPVLHDVPCYGFLINHPESGTILFLTDTYTCEYSFEGLNHILIEANYSDHVLEENIISGRVAKSMRDRLMFSHFEISKVIDYLETLNLSKVSNIVLIHLSDDNSNEDEFLRLIKEEFAINVVATGKSRVLKMEMNITPY
jgi:phosphoribosyl 1,2-cyclic phosphodiesterase